MRKSASDAKLLMLFGILQSPMTGFRLVAKVELSLAIIYRAENGLSVRPISSSTLTDYFIFLKLARDARPETKVHSTKRSSWTEMI